MFPRTVRFGLLAAAVTTAVLTPALLTSPVGAARPLTPSAVKYTCAPDARALSYSDALDQRVSHGVTIGGLSSLAYDPRSRSYVSAVDNDGSEPERLWFFRDTTSPRISRTPLVLRRPDGTAYTGKDSDNEGLAVLPDGDYLVSSETEPSIRVYGRNGVQKAHFAVPTRFRVTPKGQATDNATLEGLTVGPRGHEVIAAMEGALSGDRGSNGDATYHRLLVYRTDAAGHWRLTHQVGYRVGAGRRIPEVARYGAHGLLVEEAAYSASKGNLVRLYAVRDIDKAPDVSSVANLSAAPGKVVPKTLVANLVTCPSLGAKAKEHQTNPLMANYEGMAITGSGGAGRYRVTMISDDNFGRNQTTRVLNLSTRLPGGPRR